MSPAHGVRRRYAAGCRCVACRAANAAYANAHRIAAPPIAAAAARAHLELLEDAGLGLRQVAHLTGVATSTVAAIRSGLTQTLRASTAARLLATPAIPAPGALVPATRTWRFIDSLQREGFTRREIAWHLGLRSQQLQLAPRHCRAMTASHVAHVYHRLAVV